MANIATTHRMRMTTMATMTTHMATVTITTMTTMSKVLCSKPIAR
jgi:hypothetical protein